MDTGVVGLTGEGDESISGAHPLLGGSAAEGPEDVTLDEQWYIGEISRSESIEGIEACCKISDVPAGAFVVRYSSRAKKYIIDVCAKPGSKHIKHLEVESEGGQYFLHKDSRTCKFFALDMLIDHFSENSLASRYPQCPTQLTVGLAARITEKKTLVTVGEAEYVANPGQATESDFYSVLEPVDSSAAVQVKLSKAED